MVRLRERIYILFIENKVNDSYLDRCVAGKEKKEKKRIVPDAELLQNSFIAKITLHSSISTLYIVLSDYHATDLFSPGGGTAGS